MDRYPPLMHLQFLNQVSVVWFVVAMMLFLLSLERGGAFSRQGSLVRIVRVVGALTLEIYLVQGEAISYAQELPFPANAVVALLLTAVGTLVLHKVVTFVERKFTGMRRNG